MFFGTNTSMVKTSKLFVIFHMPTNAPINVRLDQVNNFNIFVTRVSNLKENRDKKENKKRRRILKNLKI